MRRAALALAACLAASAAASHDMYSEVRRNNVPTGILCCGGDPMTGDCEGIEADMIRETPTSVIFYSKRYQGSVEIPRSQVHMDVPRVAATGKPADPEGRFAGHWCGTRRGPHQPITAEDPDPLFHTICAFLNPGGV